MTTAVIDWNQWRRDYLTMSFAEHQAFNEGCGFLHPNQQHFDAVACEAFLEQRQPLTVVEVGGWDGALAALMLDAVPSIRSWVNYDITPGVKQVCDHPAYRLEVLDGWPWEIDVTADCLVASHVFEHMVSADVAALVDRWDVASVFVDCPVPRQARSWDGYDGSHVLEVGSLALLELFASLGYDAEQFAADDDGLIAFLDRRPA